ncbi:MAG: AmmeMemoRadiSam system radical SAM enzyme [Bacteroidales bacterium]|nr:AmmeMemoRadiSam system radical SAM enzyme [Bacteroidales bacterium]
MQEALYYKQLDNQEVQCQLCPHRCKIEPGQYGKCRTRVNQGGILFTESYGILSAISSDPIEKKPLYHFQPGRHILSIGSFGCNLNCDFCQNCEISQIDQKIFSRHSFQKPEDMVKKALLHPNNIGLAYTYNEPTVFYEYMIRCATLIKENNLSNVMVSNAYINPAPLEDLLPLMDGFNIDLKSFRNLFYKERSGASLHPVLESIRSIARSGKHLELTFLIIPDHNDDREEWRDMIKWISDYCGRETILHVSRYYPNYQMHTPPTPLSTIQEFLEHAREMIDYVYPGNTPQLDNHTYCPSCGNLLIERFLYKATVKGIGPGGFCTGCKKEIIGVFNNEAR